MNRWAGQIAEVQTAARAVAEASSVDEALQSRHDQQEFAIHLQRLAARARSTLVTDGLDDRSDVWRHPRHLRRLPRDTAITRTHCGGFYLWRMRFARFALALRSALAYGVL